jgi:hypothetical protein
MDEFERAQWLLAFHLHELCEQAGTSSAFFPRRGSRSALFDAWGATWSRVSLTFGDDQNHLDAGVASILAMRRAVRHALPTIESLTLSLPPPDGSGGSSGAQHA